MGLTGVLFGAFDNPDKQLVDSSIIGKLGVESSCQHAAFLDGYNPPVVECRQHLHFRPRLNHKRCANEHSVKGWSL